MDDDKAIQKSFVLTNFKDALEFVNKVGDLAEHHEHHPDIKIFDYKKVELKLTTHSASGLTQKDIALAKEIDKLSA